MVTPKAGFPYYYLAKFSGKMHGNERNWTKRDGVRIAGAKHYESTNAMKVSNPAVCGIKNIDAEAQVNKSS